MGLRNSIAKIIVGKAKAYELGGSGLQYFNMAVPPGWGYQSYLKAYGEIGTLFACVNVIAQAVAKVPWHLYQVNPDGEMEELFQHPLRQLIDHINPFQSRYQFMYLGTMYKLLVGEEFWQMNLNGSGVPGEIWLAPPSYMSVVPSPTEYISHYEFKRTGMDRAVRFTLAEIIHIKTPNPNNEYRGLSPAQALTTDLDSERYAQKYQQKLFFNDATPGFVLEYPADNMPPKETRIELMMEWDQRYRGYQQRGKTAFLFGAKANVITMSNKDMDFAVLRGFNRDAIMAAYHVPRSKLGITENVNRANSEQADYDFTRNCVEPELCEIRESINKELCPLFGDNLYLDFEDVVPEDSVAAVTRAVELFKNKLITRNEGRALVNMEALEDEQGNEFFSGDAAGFQLSYQPKALSGGNGGSEHPKGLFNSDDDREEYWKLYVRRVEAYENLIITSLNELFDKQSIEAVANLDHATSPQYRLVDNQKFKDDFVKVITPTLVTLLQDSIEHGMELVAPKTPHKQGPIPVVINQLALTWLETRIGWAADQVGEETSKLLGRQLVEGFKLGESTDDIAKRVRGLFSDMTKVRSKRIARTETISASNFGAQEGYREAGVKQTEWYTAIDERVCDICESLHGKVSAISEGEVPPAHPNCLLPDVRVEAAHIIAGSRAFYRGEAVEISTENGYHLTITPNHMVLAPSGFIAAKFVREGDYVIRSLDSQRITSAIDPYNDHCPSPIEDAWYALMMKDGMMVGSMPVAPIDFHGDAGAFEGNIDIIRPNSLLGCNVQARQPFDELAFGLRLAATQYLSGAGSQFPFSQTMMATGGSDMRSGGQNLALLNRHAAHSQNVGLATITRHNSGNQYSTSDNISADAIIARKLQLRFASLVAPDKVIGIRKFQFTGHVYDLQTNEQWYIANNIITHNCRCTILPVIPPLARS